MQILKFHNSGARIVVLIQDDNGFFDVLIAEQATNQKTAATVFEDGWTDLKSAADQYEYITSDNDLIWE